MIISDIQPCRVKAKPMSFRVNKYTIHNCACLMVDIEIMDIISASLKNKSKNKGDVVAHFCFKGHGFDPSSSTMILGAARSL